MKDIDLIIESLKDKTEEEITLMLKECFGEKIHNILLLQKSKLLIFLDIDGVLKISPIFKSSGRISSLVLISPRTLYRWVFIIITFATKKAF